MYVKYRLKFEAIYEDYPIFDTSGIHFGFSQRYCIPKGHLHNKHY